MKKLSMDDFGGNFNRKPKNEDEVKATIDCAKFKILFDNISIYEIDDITNVAEENIGANWLSMEFVYPPTDSIFILVDPFSWGKFYLVDTQGYNYCRYVAKLINFHEID